ncbi:MAG TPA: hypothetical protein VM261_05485 [Kofleriaceae bacterium]|nr:hypothetical protein [Kofleriaceae bacterium]
MKAKTLAIASRIGGVGAAVLALAASSTEGDRSTGGRCPAGEQCANETPEGLAFEGAQVSWFIGNGLANTAAGGSQSIKIIDNADEQPLIWPFEPKVTSTAFTAVNTGESTATLSASAVGSGYLRITRPADGYLYDRIAIESRMVSRVEARPSLTESWPGFGSDSWAAYAGSYVDVAIALYDSGGGWLVDEGMAITGTTFVRRTAWDSVEILAPSVRGTTTLSVSAGETDATVLVSVTDQLTSITGPTPQTRAVNADTEVCFSANDGSVRVFGVPYVFTITGPGQLLEDPQQEYRSCARVRATGLGTIVVTANTNGGLSATGQIDVTSSATRAKIPTGWVSRFDLGERAAAPAAADE